MGLLKITVCRGRKVALYEGSGLFVRFDAYA